MCLCVSVCVRTCYSLPFKWKLYKGGFWSTCTLSFQEYPKPSQPWAALASPAGPGHLPSSSFRASLPCYIFPGTDSLAPHVDCQHPSQAFVVWTSQLDVLLWLCPDALYPRSLYSSSGIPKPQLQVQWLFLPFEPVPTEARLPGWLPTRPENQMCWIHLPRLLKLPTDRCLIIKYPIKENQNPTLIS